MHAIYVEIAQLNAAIDVDVRETHSECPKTRLEDEINPNILGRSLPAIQLR